ncbi:MAG: hypothetical protein VYD19_11215 [Myxococcota bacterium]|nr:hypothetical protein [Myxococcota bacterium]
MLTRRDSIRLTAKGLAALMAAGPFLGGCSQEEQNQQALSASEIGGTQAQAVDLGERGAGAPILSSDMRQEGMADMAQLPAAPLSWRSFIDELAVLAEQQFSPTWDQESYVEEVAALMTLLRLDDEDFQALYDGYATAGELFPELQTVHDGGYFEVASLEFDPGDEIGLHNHPDMTGVILCLSGRIDVEAFNLQEGESESGALLLERVVQRRLEAGDYCTLTASQGNIHSLRAQSFTQLLDVFTPPYDSERLTRYRWYDRATEAYDGGELFEAWER